MLDRCKAAEDSRIPGRWRVFENAHISARFWSAAVLCRFSELIEGYEHFRDVAVLPPLSLFFILAFVVVPAVSFASNSPRQRISINDDWRFAKGDSTNNTTSLLYDARQQQTVRRLSDAEADGNSSANSAASTNESTGIPLAVIKKWILPTGNPFIKDPSRKFVRPQGNPGDDVSYVQPNFDDSPWQQISLPHDWAIEGPFTRAGGGGMGRLPSAGIGWYRKKLNIPSEDAGKSIFLDVDGAMSYSTVWLNGQLVGGWRFGYASWRVDLTRYVKPGATNALVLRLDNPPNSSRWYPGAGIYRNVWLVKTSPVHVGHWGTYLTTPQVSSQAATVNLQVTVDNNSKDAADATVSTQFFPLDEKGHRTGKAVAEISPVNLPIASGCNALAKGTAIIANPKLWGPPPQQCPNLYVAVTTISRFLALAGEVQGFNARKFARILTARCPHRAPSAIVGECF
jgi:beta-galactosidase